MFVLAALALAGTAGAVTTAPPGTPPSPSDKYLTIHSQASGGIVVAVERRLNSEYWAASSMCCPAAKCTWRYRDKPYTGTVVVKPTGSWLVTVPGHSCSVTVTGSGAVFDVASMRCKRI
jgi:hypothetical protein